MLWLYEKWGMGNLDSLKDGDKIHSRKLGLCATVTGLTTLNGHRHVKLIIHHRTGGCVEKTVSPSGLYLEGFRKTD